MLRLLALLVACLALTLVAAGCGGDDDDGGGNGNGSGGAAAETEEPPAPEAEEPADSGGGPQVSMKDIKFDPETLTIKPGETVTWTNDDTVGHDVTGDGFKSGEPGAMGGGDTYEHTFQKAGTFDYVCSVHPGMKGTVEVR
jgi:plastocyanin